MGRTASETGSRACTDTGRMRQDRTGLRQDQYACADGPRRAALHQNATIAERVARPCANHRIAGLLAALLIVPGATNATSEVAGPAPHDEGWLVTSFAEFQSPHPPADDGGELDEVKALVARRSAADVERIRWWDVGGPAYRWNQLATEEMLAAFITTLPATRNLTLLHTAIDDAVAAAWAEKRAVKRPRPSETDPSIATAIPVPDGSSYPSDYAAAAAAAAGVLGRSLAGPGRRLRRAG